MNHFILDGRYQDLLSHCNLDVEAALKKANLPEDSFKREHPTMTEQQYYSFMAAIGDQISDPFLPIQIATTDQIESFSPPIFAAYCSRNGEVFINRLAQYKPLIGPLTFQITENSQTLTIALTPSDESSQLPNFIVLSEFAFLVGMLRKTTKENISPLKITMCDPQTNNQISAFFNCPITAGDFNTITFSKNDLQINFISHNQAMWDYFKPELTKRLSEIDRDESMSGRVRSALTELLPSGEFTIDDVAQKLGYSKRTLQRKLSSEKTTFQKQLNSVREVLAKNYLQTTDMTANEIAYLLGYQELNSFLRAFTSWTGKNISEYKKDI
ncbi:MAG: AraC family transcriptional regulator ligand-binding domain-containing protein [Lactobacillus sp.]